MEDEIQKESLFRRFEAWSLEWDLHLWYGVISVIALCVLLFIIDKEVSKTVYLNTQIKVLQEDLRIATQKNSDLLIDMEKQRLIYLSQMPLEKVETKSVDKVANKVNEKITKVQDVLIDKATQTQTKVINTTETKLVSTPTVVNKELNTIMFQSYCATVPDHPTCKEPNKK